MVHDLLSPHTASGHCWPSSERHSNGVSLLGQRGPLLDAYWVRFLMDFVFHVDILFETGNLKRDNSQLIRTEHNFIENHISCGVRD